MFTNQKQLEQNLNKIPATGFSPFLNKNGRSMSVDNNRNSNNNVFQPQFPQTMPQFNQMMNPYYYQTQQQQFAPNYQNPNPYAQFNDNYVDY